MSIFIASDIHFQHKAILSYCPNRRVGKAMPETDEGIMNMVNHMNELIISNWNDMVRPDDEVYILGDVSMGMIATAPILIRRLNGKKYLVNGNHDRTLNKLIKKSDGEYDNLFAWRKDYHEMLYKVDGLKHKILICMSHYPMMCWHGMSNDPDKTSICFHGHLHGNPSGGTDRIFDVGIDNNDLHPHLLDTLVKKILKIENTRHHH